MCTEYFKHGVYSSFFFSSKCSLFHNSNIFGSCIINILYTGVLKLKKNNSGAKRLISEIITLSLPAHKAGGKRRFEIFCNTVRLVTNGD